MVAHPPARTGAAARASFASQPFDTFDSKGQAPLVATTTSTTQRSSGLSTIGLKLLMAVSGLFFVFYVLMHMYGNLKILIPAGQGQEVGHAFNEYAHHLRTMFEPILPYEGLLWIFRILLIVALVAHVYSAMKLTGRAHAARSQKYVVKDAMKTSLSSRTMRWGGVALLLFVIFHLLHFTTHNIPGSYYGGTPAEMVFDAFKNPLMVLLYLLALVALAMHLHHGTWSAMQTLGFTNTAKSRGLAKTAGVIVAAVVAIGFAIPPLAILAGIIPIN